MILLDKNHGHFVLFYLARAMNRACLLRAVVLHQSHLGLIRHAHFGAPHRISPFRNSGDKSQPSVFYQALWLMLIHISVWKLMLLEGVFTVLLNIYFIISLSLKIFLPLKGDKITPFNFLPENIMASWILTLLSCVIGINGREVYNKIKMNLL